MISAAVPKGSAAVFLQHGKKPFIGNKNQTFMFMRHSLLLEL
jgi:hypothetical protein